MRLRLRLLWFVGAMLLSATTIQAQTADPGDRLGFDQAAPTLADANGYTYRLYVDGAAVGVVVTATCTGAASPFVCVAAFPALTTGSHTVQLTAGLGASASGESGKSAAFTFVLRAVPAIPAALRIAP